MREVGQPVLCIKKADFINILKEIFHEWDYLLHGGISSKEQQELIRNIIDSYDFN